MGPQSVLASLKRVNEIAEALRGVDFGKTRVEDVFLDVRDDANGELALFVDLTLSDPYGDTWPSEDILAIRRSVLDVARKIPPIELPIYIDVSPKTDTPQEGDAPQEGDGRLFGNE